MVSFDVTSLNTNIPIIDTQNIIKDYVNNDDQFPRRMAIHQDKFLDLLHLLLITTGTLLILSFTNKVMVLPCEPNIFNYYQNLYAGLWTHCNKYAIAPSKSLGRIC